MTKDQFLAEGRAISTEAAVLDTLHNYFVANSGRILHGGEFFKLFDRPLGDVLEIGPFYGYLPFALRPRASSYTVIEGDDPAVHPLLPVYKKRDIKVELLDLFDLFGPVIGAPHALPIPDGQFDTIICWETMEHFNFNPVKFVRELLRVLKPGGKAFVTVPNNLSLPNLLNFFFHRKHASLVDGFFTYEDYESGGKKAFFGTHWREYAPAEFERLFAKAGFTIVQSGTFVAFRSHGGISLPRKAYRAAYQLAAKALPSWGTNAFVIGEKPV